VFEKQACQLADNDSAYAYSDTVIAVLKKMYTSLLNQIYNHKIEKNKTIRRMH
jgi:hypothetical protein